MVPGIRLSATGLSLLVAACSSLALEVNGDDETALRAARLRWNRERPAAYSYQLERLCFCGPEANGPVRIVVQGDSVLSRAYTATGQPVGAAFRQYFGPMEAVFEVVALAIEREAASLTVEYDPVRGYPVTVTIDYAEHVADDELTLRVTEFRTLSE